jgi:flagellar basal-body rod protein FlgG
MRILVVAPGEALQSAKACGASGDALVAALASEGIGSLGQGLIEMSNVNIIEEMVSMVVAQRAYEVNSKAIQVADEMLSMASSRRR